MASTEPPDGGDATGGGVLGAHEDEAGAALVQLGAYHSLDRRGRRRLILGVLGRVFGITAVLLLVYFVLPLDWDGKASGVVVLIVGLIGIAVLTTFTVRAIVDAPYPQLRAVEGLAVIIPSVVVTFAYTYVWLSNANPHNFTQPIDRVAGIYFVVTTLSTTGFGDIAAVTSLARIIVTLQMLLDLVFIGIVAKLIFGASRIGVQRRQAEAASGSRPASTAGSERAPADAPPDAAADDT
jgi:hypothetical protein